MVIDTDPGTDDALALMMAVNSPDLEVEALTTVGGNASLAHTTRNALRLVHYLGRSDLPVFKGSARPLRGRFHYAPYFHGPGGLTARLPAVDSAPAPPEAPDYIRSVPSRLRGKLVLIALGPLTNIARTIQSEPRVTDWISRIVVMGGAVDVPGNVTSHAEFNIYNDPVAANVVFSSGVPVTLVGLDVCRQVYFVSRDVPSLSAKSVSGRLAGRILVNWFKSHPDAQYHMCDPLAIVAVIRPELFSYRMAKVSVEVGDAERLGETTATYGSGNVQVAVAVQAREAKELIQELVAGER